MGTHSIFESDFDCLTANILRQHIEWCLRCAYVLFTCAIDSVGSIESFYVRIIHDAAGHLIQSLIICGILVKDLTAIQPVIFVPAFMASLIDLDHFIAARSFSLIKATSLVEQATLHNMLLPIGIVITAFTFKRFGRDYISFLIPLAMCLIVHLYRDG